MVDEIEKGSVSINGKNVESVHSENKAEKFFDSVDSEFKCPACGNMIHYGDKSCKKCGQEFYWKM